MEKRGVDRDAAIPPDHEPPEVSQPGKGSFDLPSPTVAAQVSAIVKDPSSSGLFPGHNTSMVLTWPPGPGKFASCHA